MSEPSYMVFDTERDGDWAGLSSPQLKALLALLTGKSTTEAAKDAGVRRETVSFWKHHCRVFQVHLITARRELYGQILQSLWSEALASIRYLAEIRDSKFADADQRMKAAQALLKAAAWPSSAVTPAGPNLSHMEILGEMYSAEADEADNLQVQALNQMTVEFNPPKKRAEIEALRLQIAATERQLRDVDADEAAQQPTQADLTQLRDKIHTLRWKLKRRESAYERFKARVQHVCDSFECVHEPEVDE